MKGCSICFFINLFVCLNAKSQDIYNALPSSGIKSYRKPAKTPVAGIKVNSKPAADSIFSVSIQPMPKTFYFNSIGFFCKKELQIEKALRFPVKLRLGSVAYTDQMEGKVKEVH